MYQGDLHLKIAQIIADSHDGEISREQLELSLRQMGVDPSEWEGQLEEMLMHVNSLYSEIEPDCAEMEPF